jgi:hypothetical protein
MNIEEIPNQNAQAPVDLPVGFDAPNKTLDQRPAIESQKQVEGQGELPQKPDSESNIGDQEQKQSPAGRAPETGHIGMLVRWWFLGLGVWG